MLGGVLSFRVSVLGNAGWVGVVNFFVVVVACYRDLCFLGNSAFRLDDYRLENG